MPTLRINLTVHWDSKWNPTKKKSLTETWHLKEGGRLVFRRWSMSLRRGCSHSSVVANQEDRERQQKNQGQGPPPGRRGGRREAPDAGRGQVRGQQLLMEDQVVHGQVIRQVWETGSERWQRRDRGGCGAEKETRKNQKCEGRQEEGINMIMTNTVTEVHSASGMSVLLSVQCLAQL